MEPLGIREFCGIIHEEDQSVVGELFTSLRALTQIEGVDQVSFQMSEPENSDFWGWTAWW